MFRIKICGLTTPENARQVVEAGADAIGLNFFQRGTRYITLGRAVELAAVIPSTVAKVGVFVNSMGDEVREIARTVPLDFVQLHGDEPPELAAELAASGLKVIRAMRCKVATLAGPLAWLEAFRQLGGNLAGILIDAEQAGHFGGTGQRADWGVLEHLRKAVPGTRLILAGGLNPTNVAEAIRAARPDAVDTASGVESAPGEKDPPLVRRFVDEARVAFETLASK